MSKILIIHQILQLLLISPLCLLFAQAQDGYFINPPRTIEDVKPTLGSQFTVQWYTGFEDGALITLCAFQDNGNGGWARLTLLNAVVDPGSYVWTVSPLERLSIDRRLHFGVWRGHDYDQKKEKGGLISGNVVMLIPTSATTSTTTSTTESETWTTSTKTSSSTLMPTSTLEPTSTSDPKLVSTNSPAPTEPDDPYSSQSKNGLTEAAEIATIVSCVIAFLGGIYGFRKFKMWRDGRQNPASSTKPVVPRKDPSIDMKEHDDTDDGSIST